MSTESASNGTQNSLVNDKSRRHPRWTRQETLSLIQAKEITENSPHKGRKMSSSASALMASSSISSSSMENTEPKWVMISSYCKKQGVKRGPAQCRKRWSNLLGDFKKVKAWESKLKDKADSFWTMRNDLRKENKLPVSFDVEVFKVLEGRETGAGAVSPLPLQAVALVSEVANDEEEVEEIVNGGDGVFLDVKDDFLCECKDGEQGILALQWKEEVKMISDNVTENPVVQNLCTPETISEEQHQQAFQEQNNNSNQDTATNGSREPDPGNNWDSQEKGKRRRLFTDDEKANCSESQILKVLEANNKLLNSQLDIHNKNCQLDREQRKENKDALVATLSKLNDVLTKIAEKL